MTDSINPTCILTRDEVLAVLDDLHRRGKKSVSARLNLAIFRLSACCGLRCKEIAGLLCGDLLLGGSRPVVIVRKENTKGRVDERRARKVPLWWDKGTYDDLSAWVEEIGAGPKSNVVVSVCGDTFGLPLTRGSIARRWATAIGVLGHDRVSQLSIHKGRHTFISHALHTGHGLPSVRDAAGHSSINRTSIYLHAIDSDEIPDMFSRGDK